MVLHHASVVAPNKPTAVDWLKEIAVGIARLVRDEVAQKTLRMSQSTHDIRCLTNWSLFDAYQELRRDGARDAYQFLMSLSSKAPLLSDIGQEVKDRFLGCEATKLPRDDGEPLVLCAITDMIAVGFPSASVWDRDQIQVNFEELLPDYSLGEAFETIDNLTRCAHAQPICDRHRSDARRFTNFRSLWENREKAFPNLLFGPDVESQLEALTTTFLGSVVKRLASLDESVGEWRAKGGSKPIWKCSVTGESDSVMNSEKLREARRFRSPSRHAQAIRRARPLRQRWANTPSFRFTYTRS